MAPEATDPATLVGQWVRRLRTERGWRQEDVAQAAASVGLTGWTRATVANVESGQRQVTVEEALLLARTMGAPLSTALPTDAAELVQLGDVEPAAMFAGIARWYLSGGKQGSADTWPRGDDGLPRRDRGPGEATAKAAVALGWPAESVDLMSAALWARAFEEERDVRVAAALKGDETPRTLQAMRGHTTRRLIRELELARKRLPSLVRAGSPLVEDPAALRRVLRRIGERLRTYPMADEEGR